MSNNITEKLMSRFYGVTMLVSQIIITAAVVSLILIKMLSREDEEVPLSIYKGGDSTLRQIPVGL